MPHAAAGTKRPRPASEPKKPSATRSLSGATKNMRFMQRGVKRKSEEPRQKSKNAKNDATIPVAAFGDMNEKDSVVGRQEQEEQSAATAMQHPKTPPKNKEGAPYGSDEEMHDSDDSPITVAASTAAAPVLQATPLDMYGWEQSQALGRRSFGGFQPVTAENWYHQQQEHRAASNNTARKLQPSDQELLRRHEEIISNNSDKKHRKQQQGRRQKQISGGLRGTAERRNKLLDDFLME